MLPHIDYYNQNVSGAQTVRNPELEKPTDTAKTAPPEKKNETDIVNNRTRAAQDNGGNQDKVEINFSLSREEREAFSTAFANRDNPSVLSEEERETLQKASERISKFIDDAIARNTSSRERVEKAVGEWYTLLTRGEPRGSADLINLLRQAAMGNFDTPGE